MTEPWLQHPDKPLPPPGSPGPRAVAREALIDRAVVMLERYRAGRAGRYGVRLWVNRYGWQLMTWRDRRPRPLVTIKIKAWRWRPEDGPRLQERRVHTVWSAR